MKTADNKRDTTLAGYAFRFSLVLALLSAICVLPVFGSDQTTRPYKNSSDLNDLSLDALLDLEVTSASRKLQKLSSTAASVTIITLEDIRRSGATSIPDLLRMVPGVQVARIDANKWAVSIRGFNGRFSNKLLVMKDGRSIYTPLFSGVYWEQQDTPLDTIERIEIIRGPGAALWGANAVNGVINIITRTSTDTRGGFLSGGGGSSERGFGSMRYGFGLGESTDLQLHGAYTDRSSGHYSNGSTANDSWQNGTGGFRLDSRITGQDTLTVQGDYYNGRYNETYTLFKVPTTADTSYNWIQQSAATGSGGSLLARWQRTFTATDNLSLQLWYNHYQRNMYVLGEKRDTVDLEFQHRFALGERQDIVWGLGYRYSHDNLNNTPFIIFSQPNKGSHLFSAFINDEITLLPNKLSLTIGSRFEHNDYTGLEIQPTGRLTWTPATGHTLWGAVSRAVRTPSRGERDIQYRFRTLPSGVLGPLPVRLEIDGSDNFKSETVTSFEAGYRSEPLPRLSVDVTVFYNLYDRLRVRQNEFVGVEPPSNTVVQYPLGNNMHGHTYGAELSINWSPFDWWKLQATYSYLCSIMTLDGSSIDTINRGNAAGGSPRHQGSLRSGFDIGRQFELDLWLRMVDRVFYIDDVTIPGYVTLDARIAWKPVKSIELAVIGQNLFQRRHPEYIPEFINTTPSETPRGVYGKVTWKF